MLIDIDKIKVTDRIRKDFGNLEELAQDIKENGLINPPVVTPDYVLIAGERRLRACKLLGYKQIEVRIMTVNDFEHQLKLEISENENRKEFTFSERVEWARRLEEIERLKARERQITGGKENFPEGPKGQTRDIVAEQAGFGSGRQYEKAKFIADHADEEMIRQLDEEKISIHAAYQKLKKQLQEAEQRAEQAQKEAAHWQKVAREHPVRVETKTITVVPDNIQKELADKERKLRAITNEYEKLKAQLDEYQLRDTTGFDEQQAELERKKLQHEADISTLQLAVHFKTFIEKASITPHLYGAIATASESEKQRLHELAIAAQTIINQTFTALRGRKEIER